MNRGYVRLWRKTADSRIFQNEGLLKVWIWCLLRAAHKEIWVSIKTGRGQIEALLKPGQFIFGRETAGKKLRMKPSTVWVRMLKLERLGNVNIESNRQYSIITIINWPAYQGGDEKNDSEADSQMTGKQQPNDTYKNDKNEKNITPDLFSLCQRYSDRDLIDRAFSAIASTRKCGKVADSVLHTQLQRWKRYPVDQVEAGIKIYLEKNYASQGKKEEYLLGIIRNHNKSDLKHTEDSSVPFHQPKEITAENAEELYAN